MRCTRKTRRWFLYGASGFILLTIMFWRPLQQRCVAYVLVHAEAPSEEALSAAVEQASDPACFLLDLWKTQRVPHRQFVLSYLGRVSTSSPDLWRALEPLTVEAVGDPDITARESAFAVLTRMKHPRLRTLALEQLSDPDPAARLTGLHALRSIASSNDVAVTMRLLDDPEPRVVVAAALVLRQATGQDFGLRSSQAVPQFTCIETNPPPAPDLAAIHQGVRRWKEWWTGHQAEFPAAPMKLGSPTHVPGLPTWDFSLKDSTGKPVRLSQFRGQTVLLAFWSADTPASLDDVPALRDLQQRYSSRLAVIGVCLPAAPCCADEHEQGHDHAQHHHDESAAGMTGPEHMGCLVQDAIARLKISYPMVADAKGAVGQRFSIENVPSYVLIDAAGRVRRRVVGFRTESVLAAMVEETATPDAARAAAKE